VGEAKVDLACGVFIPRLYTPVVSNLHHMNLLDECGAMNQI
jgi:hypothetical protein